MCCIPLCVTRPLHIACRIRKLQNARDSVSVISIAFSLCSYVINIYCEIYLQGRHSKFTVSGLYLICNYHNIAFVFFIFLIPNYVRHVVQSIEWQPGSITDRFKEILSCCYILGAFAKLKKQLSVSTCLSLCPPDDMEQLD